MVSRRNGRQGCVLSAAAVIVVVVVGGHVGPVGKMLGAVEAVKSAEWSDQGAIGNKRKI